VGKTRLAVEALQRAEQAGMATARVTATRSAAGLPLGALAPLLPAADHRDVGMVDDRVELLRRSAAALIERAGGRRLALLVDDAQLLDDTSATLIHQLAAIREQFILATVLSGAPAPDPVMALWKDGVVERLEVVGLHAEAVEELLSGVLGGPVDPAAAVQLAVRCQGNVLFLRELVLGAITDGALRDEGGIWRLAGPLAPSPRLVELVEARLGRLNSPERSLLELVSVGEPIGSAELTALADPDVAETLERRALLFSRMDGRRLEVRLAHAIYGDVLRARIPALRARDISRSLAETVEATGARRREDTLRVATWRLIGGGARPELLVAAATTARWRYDFPLAERLARAALDAGAGFDAALLAAQLASLQGRGTDAETELTALATRATDDAERGLVAISRLDNSVFYLGQVEKGLRLAEEAEATIADPARRDEIAAKRSWVMLLTHGPKMAAEAVQPLLQRAQGRAQVWTCISAAYSLGRLGHLIAALDAADQGYAAHLALTTPLEWYPWIHLFIRAETLAHAGPLEQAEALATAQYRQGLADHSPEAQAHFALGLSHINTERGRVRTAARFGQEAVALFRQLARPLLEGVGLQACALALALSGQPNQAADALAALDALNLPRAMLTELDLLRARAWTAIAAGDLPQGRQLLEDAAAALGEDIGDLVGATTALHDLARLGDARKVSARLKTLAARIEGDLASARAAHTQALARGDPDGLEKAAALFQATGANLLAAEAAADAAVAWRQTGYPRKATTAEHQAITLADRCEDATTPALQAIETRARLTAAERETARLAAAGRSNKQIADELCLSLRTVESRLQHVYEKLGVSRRSELAAALETRE
jgi:DNA-binding CsgD family transcriptional regulator